MQTLKSRLQRWEQLSRYYVNKWHYDGSKFVERVWYGQGTLGANRVAQVPFMITRNMRQQLEAAGFPSDEISRMLPKVAHQVITDKVTYVRYAQQKQEQKEIESIVQAAKDALAKEEQTNSVSEVTIEVETTTTSVAIVAAESQTSSCLNDDAGSQKSQETAVSSVAIVAQQESPKA